MIKPYYSDEHVTLYHGDCREVTAWLAADVLVTDPPYGIGWRRGENKARSSRPAKGIANDGDTAARDAALAMWGDRPALVFAAPLLPPPDGARHALVWRKPEDAGVVGSSLPWRRDVEMVYALGTWPRSTGTASSVLTGPRGLRAYSDGSHPHMKPTGLMSNLLAACPPGIAADPFAGSGATLVAAKHLGRRAIGVELEERYCEIAAKRLAQGVLDFGSAS